MGKWRIKEIEINIFYIRYVGNMISVAIWLDIMMHTQV